MQLRYIGPSHRRIIGWKDFENVEVDSDSVLVDFFDVVEVNDAAAEYLLTAEPTGWEKVLYVADDSPIVTDDKEIVTDDAEEVK